MLFTSIQPMLVGIGNEVFDDERYIYEPKWDGWRLLLHKSGTRIEAYTRKGRTVTEKFPELQEAVSAIKTESAILDCEGICLREGRPVFDDFSYRGRLSDPIKIKNAPITHPATFVVFDCLYTSKAHTNEPLMDRKKRLAETVGTTPVLMPTLFVEGTGKALKALSEERDLEGIVAKRKDSKYYTGQRVDHWLKYKNWKTIDCVILGYRTAPTFALVIGLQFRTIKNKPVGLVEYGFSPEEKTAFLEAARQLHTEHDGKTQWMVPHLCCSIQYLERTDRHQLRTTVFKGFLPGKQAEDCRWVYR